MRLRLGAYLEIGSHSFLRFQNTLHTLEVVQIPEYTMFKVAASLHDFNLPRMSIILILYWILLLPFTYSTMIILTFIYVNEYLVIQSLPPKRKCSQEDAGISEQ